MSAEQKSSTVGPRNQQIRQDMVNTAVNFLLNPSVINTLYEHKAAFLRKKGLTDAEIVLAYEKAESNPNYKQIQQSSHASNNPRILPPPVPMYRPVSFWSQLSRFSSSLIVLGVAVFGAHYVYKKYIEPLIFGGNNENKPESLEKQLFDMTIVLSHLESHVSSLEESINCQKVQMDKFLQNEVSEYYPTPLALRELKTEISSVKSLLLNRHQFPALPKVTPAIPQWQLSSKENENETKPNGEANENECFGEKTGPILKPYHELELEHDNDDTTKQSNGVGEIIISEVKTSQDQYFEESNNESVAS